MAYQPRPNSGTFRRSTTKKHPNAPDYWGDVTVDASVIQYLMQAYKANLEPKLKLSGWNKQNKRDGSTFISLSVEIPQDVRQQPQQRQQNGYGQQVDAFAPQAQQQRAYGNGQAQRGYSPQAQQQPQQQGFEDPFNDEIPWK